MAVSFKVQSSSQQVTKGRQLWPILEVGLEQILSYSFQTGMGNRRIRGSRSVENSEWSWRYIPELN